MFSMYRVTQNNLPLVFELKLKIDKILSKGKIVSNLFKNMNVSRIVVLNHPVYEYFGIDELANI